MMVSSTFPCDSHFVQHFYTHLCRLVLPEEVAHNHAAAGDARQALKELLSFGVDLEIYTVKTIRIICND